MDETAALHIDGCAKYDYALGLLEIQLPSNPLLKVVQIYQIISSLEDPVVVTQFIVVLKIYVG